MDYTLKWPESYALKNVTSETVKCLVDLNSGVRIPELLTDNGSKFVSKTMENYCQTMGIKQIIIFPYQLQTDKMVKRFNATIKTVLRKLIQNFKVDWTIACTTCVHTGEIFLR